MRASVDYSTLHVESDRYSLAVAVKPVYDRVEGPKHRIDVKMAMRQTPSRMHGLLGQGFYGPRRDGRVDVYPSSGNYTTVAWAEGAIDGVPEDYETKARYDTGFAFSAFGTGSYYVRNATAERWGAAESE